MTRHEIIVRNSKNLATIENGLINLIVTSPPYPMIRMWDQMFANQNSEIAFDLQSGDGTAAFNKMHRLLDEVWEECDR
ncbi:MAG: site-specific DNA-methyltransferase, partial [Alkaliphilus sp.]|nr:site-specific DNA-methyltransferase [Alkaliphilus sp.]